MDPITLILGLCAGLFIVAVVVIALANASFNKPGHYDDALAKAQALSASGRRKDALKTLERATKLLTSRESLKPELAIRLARLQLAQGKLLFADGKTSTAATKLRAAITAPHAERDTIDGAVVTLITTKLATADDLPHLRAYVDRVSTHLANTDPLPAALDPAYFTSLLANMQSRQSAQALVEALYSKGVRIAWLSRLHGHALAESEKTDDALRIFRQLTAGTGADRGDRSMLGKLLARTKKWKEALAIQKLLANETQSTAKDCYEAGQTGLALYAASKDKAKELLDDCIRWLTRATQLDASNADGWGFLGRAHRLRGNRDEARVAYDRAADCGSDGAPKRMSIAEALLEMDMAAAALPHLQRAAELSDADAKLWHRVGQLALDLGDNTAAIHALERAVKCVDASADAGLLLAAAHAKAENYARVVAILNDHKALPNSSLLLLAHSLVRLGRNSEAADRLLTYLKSHAKNEEVRCELGMLYGRQAQWEKAAEQFAMLKDSAMVMKALPYAAYVNLRAGRLDVAARLVQAADGSGPDGALLHHVAASLAVQRGDTAAAEAAWENALMRDPKFPAALHAYARFCENTRNYAKAVTIYTSLQKELPDDAKNSVRLGVCCARTGRYAEAIEAFTRAGTSIDADTEALGCLAFAHAKLNNWEAATSVLGRLPKSASAAAAIQRNSFLVRYEYARKLYGERAYAEARKELQLLPAHQLNQSIVTRALYAAHIGCVSELLPPKEATGMQQLRSELDQLQRIAPASFAARILPPLLELMKSGAAPKWSQIAEVKPTNPAQHATLAILATAAGELEISQRLLEGSSQASASFLRGIAAAKANNWRAAFDSLQAGLQAGSADYTCAGDVLRLTAACGISADRTSDVLDLLRTHAADPEAARILGVMAAAEGRSDDAEKLLKSPGISGAGAEDARRKLLWHRLRTMLSHEDPMLAIKAIKAAPDDVRSHQTIVRIELELQIRCIENFLDDDARLKKARQILRSIAPDLLLPPHSLRRAAIAATKLAARSNGSREIIIADHRLAAALWGTALEGDYVWSALDRQRVEDKKSPYKTDQRVTLRNTAREQLLSSIRSFAAQGWSKDEVDLGCAWIEFEFQCAMLFERSGVGYGWSQWPKGLAAARMLLLEDTLDKDARGARTGLRAARRTITAVLEQHARDTQQSEDSTPARQLAAYLAPAGFSYFLLDTDRPHLALIQLKDAPKNDAALRDVRGRALAAQAAKLSTSTNNASEALTMFEQAAALKANLISSRSAIIDAAVAASRNLLNTNADNPTAALQPLDVAARLAGRTTPLDQARARVFVQQALKQKAADDLDGAVKKLRDALTLSDDQETRSTLAEAVQEQAIQVLLKRQLDRALELQRESLRLNDSVDAEKIDYQARCDLQMFLIRRGAAIAGEDSAGLNEANIAVRCGLDARSILDDDDAHSFLAYAYHEVGRYQAIAKRWDAAISALELAMSLSNKEGHRKFLARLLLIRGAKAYDAGNRSAGTRDINRAHDLDPNEPDIHSVWLRI